MLNRVDLPQPLGPMTLTNSPSATSRSRPGRPRHGSRTAWPARRCAAAPSGHPVVGIAGGGAPPQLSGTREELVGRELRRIVGTVQDLRLLGPGEVVGQHLQ